MNETLLLRINRLQRLALIVGAISAVVCVVGACVNLRQFLISYLFAWLFWLGLSLGCLCVAMIHHLTGGRWGDVTRRFLEAGYMTVPLMAVLFIPILLGLRELYPWRQFLKNDCQYSHSPTSRQLLEQHAAFIIPGRCFYFIVWISDGNFPQELVTPPEIR